MRMNLNEKQVPKKLNMKITFAVIGFVVGFLLGRLEHLPKLQEVSQLQDVLENAVDKSIMVEELTVPSCSKLVKVASMTKLSPNKGSVRTPSIKELEAYDADKSIIHHLAWTILPDYTLNQHDNHGSGSSDTTAFIFDNCELPEISGKTALDIGTVNRCTAFELEWQGAKNVYAMDIYSPDHFGFDKLHKLLNSKVTFLYSTLYFLPEFFDEETFDLIIFAGVIYYLHNPISSIDALYKVLKPGGTLVVETAAVSDPNLAEELFPKGMKYRWIAWCHHNECNNDTTNTFIFTKDSLTSFFESNGFTMKQIIPRPNDKQVHRLVAVFTRNKDRNTGYHVNPDVILPAYPCPKYYLE